MLNNCYNIINIGTHFQTFTEITQKNKKNKNRKGGRLDLK